MRDAFLLDPDTVFLNHGSFGACPAEVFAVYQGWQREMERNPVAFLGRRSGALLVQARAVWAQALGARADDLAFVSNATTGVNIVAQSLPLQPGDEVLATDHEYGACDAAWQHICAQRGAHYRRVAIPLPFCAEEFVPRLMAAVTPRTRMVFASHITSTTALVFPVQALCRAARECGLLTLIDSAHAPGQVPLDLSHGPLGMGADFCTGNAHKWLCAPKGAAFLHVRPEHHRWLQPSVISWGHVAGADGAAADEAPSALDAFTGRSALQRRLQWKGTQDLAACLSVPAALDFQARHDWPAQRARCHDMAVATMHRVLARNGLPPIARDADFAQMAPIPVRLPPGMAAEELRRRLFDDFRIEVPVTQHARQTFVRVSVQAYNTDADLDALVSALAALDV